ncbi:MAG: hypothetical protein ACTS6G_02615 [Candidatus Hodgkinia cicadicola]
MLITRVVNALSSVLIWHLTNKLLLVYDIDFKIWTIAWRGNAFVI